MKGTLFIEIEFNVNWSSVFHFIVYLDMLSYYKSSFILFHGLDLMSMGCNSSSLIVVMMYCLSINIGIHTNESSFPHLVCILMALFSIRIRRYINRTSFP